MRAILIAADEPASMQLMSARYPLALFHLMDRPVLQVAIEYLIEQGILDFHLVLNHLPEAIEDYFGDGQRWGCTIKYHLCKDPKQPYGALHTIDIKPDESPALLGHIHTLPAFPDKSLQAAASDTVQQFVFAEKPTEDGDRTSPPPCWTGWATVPVSTFSQLPRQAEYSDIESAIGGLPHTSVSCEQMLRFDTYPALLQANLDVLSGQFPHCQPVGILAEPGVFINRNVMIHPTANVTPPVYIGENSHIGANVQLGPDVVIGSGSILDVGSDVEHTVVTRNSYVGQSLELDGVIIDKNLLINTRLDIETHIHEQFMISELSGKPLRSVLGKGLSALAGLVLWVITLPVLLLVYVALVIGRRGPVFHKQTYLRIPIHGDERWREFTALSFTPSPKRYGGLAHCLLAALPALGSVVRGDMRLVGLPPRSPEEVEQLPDDWRALYLQGNPGLVTEAAVRYGHQAGDDERYAADVYYAVHANGWYDTLLFFSGIGRVFRRSRPVEDVK